MSNNRRFQNAPNPYDIQLNPQDREFGEMSHEVQSHVDNRHLESDGGRSQYLWCPNQAGTFSSSWSCNTVYPTSGCHLAPLEEAKKRFELESVAQPSDGKIPPHRRVNEIETTLLHTNLRRNLRWYARSKAEAKSLSRSTASDIFSFAESQYSVRNILGVMLMKSPVF